MLKKKATHQEEGGDIPNLKQSANKHRRNRKQDKNKIALEEESHTSEELGNSKLVNDEEDIANGHLKNR